MVADRLILIALSLLAAFVFPAPVFSAAAPEVAQPFTVQDLVRLERISEPCVAPDGKRIAYTLRTTDMEANKARTGIWMLDTRKRGALPVRLTDIAANASSAEWSADGNSLYYLSNRSGSNQVWRVRARGDAPRDDAVQVTHLPLDVDSFRVAPKGDRILVSLEVFIDCPDLASGANTDYADLSVKQFRKVIEQHIECLNYALKTIPPEQVRIHICWGNYEGPHHRDIALSDVIDIVLKANVTGITIESANPRHGHEWKIWQEMKLPDGKILFPGVIDDTTSSNIQSWWPNASFALRNSSAKKTSLPAPIAVCATSPMPVSPLQNSTRWRRAPDWRPASCGIDLKESAALRSYRLGSIRVIGIRFPASGSDA